MASILVAREVQGLTQMGFDEVDCILLVHADLWKFLLSRQML
jgi:hypothetical protein